MADPRDRAKTPCFSAALVPVLYEKGEKAPARREERGYHGEREKGGGEREEGWPRGAVSLHTQHQPAGCVACPATRL